MTQARLTETLNVLRKLRRMSIGEIGGRSRETVRRTYERSLWRRLRDADRPTVVDVSSLLPDAAQLVPGATRQELQRVQIEFPDVYDAMRRRVVAVKHAIASGQWKMLGHAFDLRPPIDWHRDPRSEFRWSPTFYADQPLYSLPVGVDVKYIWELGRQQYLPELARAWLLTGDEDAAHLARSLLLSWIEANPIYEGIHWTSALEVAMRSISWLWTLATLSDWGGWQTSDLEQIAGSLVDHARYLEHHFSFHSSPYNHLIGEATALLLIAHACADWHDAMRWRERSKAVLTTFGPRQFSSEGFCVEQATGYHFYTLGFLVLAIAAERAAGQPCGRLETVARQAFLTGAAFRRPDGRWPEIGDVDSARSIPVHPADFWSFDSLCHLGAALFNEPRLKTDDENPGEEMYWLLGAAGLAWWKSLPTNPRSTRIVLPTSGYVIAGDDQDWLLFDAGPVAAGLFPDATPSVAHGHADVFHVLYMKGRTEILADAGMPCYGGGRPDWTAHFRSAAAHNTLEIEGVEPVRAAGALAWSHEQPAPTLSACLGEAAWLCSGHAIWGKGSVTVERHLCAIPGCGLWTADIIETDRPRQVRWHWHSRRSFFVAGRSDHLTLKDPDPATPFGVWTTGDPLRVEDVMPNAGSPESTLSTGYGETERGVVLRVSTVIKRRTLVVTRIGTAHRFDVHCGDLTLASEGCGESQVLSRSVYEHAGVRWRIAVSSDNENRTRNRLPENALSIAHQLAGGRT